MDRERDIAVATVREALRLTTAVQPDESHEKSDRSPVTVADFGSQAIVCRALAAAFPEDPVIGEEDSASLRESDLLAQVVEQVVRLRPEADERAVCEWIDRGDSSDYEHRFWTLDPIDGTRGFLRGGHYAVALALLIGGEPVVGVLGCPKLGAIFSAVSGAGARAEPIGGGEATPVHASNTGDPSLARLCESVEAAHSAHDEHAIIAKRLGITSESIRMDSQAKYAAVARGDADIYLRLPRSQTYVEKIWDHAAGAAVLTEAGGKVTDVHGNKLDFTHGRLLAENKGIVATNAALHDAVLAAVRELSLP